MTGVELINLAKKKLEARGYIGLATKTRIPNVLAEICREIVEESSGLLVCIKHRYCKDKKLIKYCSIGNKKCEYAKC